MVCIDYIYHYPKSLITVHRGTILVWGKTTQILIDGSAADHEHFVFLKTFYTLKTSRAW